MKLGRTTLGDIVPAMYPIPANPVMAAYYAEQAALAAASGKKGVSGLGVFIPAIFNEPENPVMRGQAGLTNSTSNALDVRGSFNGPKQLTRPKRNAVVTAQQTMKASGPTSSGLRNSVNGLGDFDLTSFTAFTNSITSGVCTTPGANCLSTSSLSVGGIPGNYVLLGGLVLLAVLATQSRSKGRF